MRVLVTGANGFIGRAIVGRGLRDAVHALRVATRQPLSAHGALDVRLVGNLSGALDWSDTVSNVDAVIHTSARVHVMRDTAADPLAEFRRVNVEGTRRLAQQAAAAGVRRFVFLSSIKVNGERTEPGHPYTAEAEPRPLDAYGVSKLEAELALREVGAATAMEVVVIRPVLVHGPGAKGNLLSMMQWLARGIPLPLGGISNRRSLVGVDNLVDLVWRCVGHASAAGECYLVSDGEDLSTSELLRRTSAALGVRPRLFPIPPFVIRQGTSIIGRPSLGMRLCDSLQVDIRKTRDRLGWSPPISVTEGLDRMAQHFLAVSRAG
jgi:nucleoside-diphosphate-sugar epimerase